jgi:hypothetical protein
MSGRQESKSEMNFLTKKLEKTMAPSGPGKVVDIKKYLAQTQDNPKILHKNGVCLCTFVCTVFSAQ